MYDKQQILKKLKLLIELCETTDLERPPTDNELFSDHLVIANELFDKVNLDLTYPDRYTGIMKHANKLWRLRNRIAKGENSPIYYLQVLEKIEDFIAEGYKLSAIKYYRQVLKESFDEAIGLKEAKGYVDSISADMRRRGIIQ